MVFEYEIISQLSREVIFLYQHQEDVEASLITLEQKRRNAETKNAAIDMAIKFPQIRSLGLLIHLNKRQFQIVKSKIFENNDQQKFILLLVKRISNQKKLMKAFSGVLPASFNPPANSKKLSGLFFNKYIFFSFVGLFLILTLLFLIDLNEFQAVKIRTFDYCSNCYQIDNITFSFEYFDNDAVYNNIAFQDTSPKQLASSLSNKSYIFRLPTLHEIQKLLNAIKTPSIYNFFHPIPDIFMNIHFLGKKIYIQGDNQYKIPVADINQNNSCQLDNVDYGDEAYLIFIVEINK